MHLGRAFGARRPESGSSNGEAQCGTGNQVQHEGQPNHVDSSRLTVGRVMTPGQKHGRNCNNNLFRGWGHGWGHDPSNTR